MINLIQAKFICEHDFTNLILQILEVYAAGSIITESDIESNIEALNSTLNCASYVFPLKLQDDVRDMLFTLMNVDVAQDFTKVNFSFDCDFVDVYKCFKA